MDRTQFPIELNVKKQCYSNERLRMEKKRRQRSVGEKRTALGTDVSVERRWSPFSFSSPFFFLFFGGRSIPLDTELCNAPSGGVGVGGGRDCR